jgi:hypothetical protein
VIKLSEDWKVPLLFATAIGLLVAPVCLVTFGFFIVGPIGFFIAPPLFAAGIFLLRRHLQNLKGKKLPSPKPRSWFLPRQWRGLPPNKWF